MNLEIGKYVRTCNGTIFKIVGGNEDKWDIDISYSCLSRLEDEDYTSYAYNKNNSFFKALAKKASHEPIDLIEVGDYVNGFYVIGFDTLENGENAVIVNADITYGYGMGVIPEKEIYSIATNENFSKIEYEIDD